MKLKIMSYNIHSGVGRDKIFSYKRIGQFLASLKPDIVCLQEMDLRNPDLNTSEQIEALKAGYFEHFVFNPAVIEKEGDYGNAILSKFKPESVDDVDVSYSDNQPRNIQHIEFNKNGYQFIVLNTHLGLELNERAQQFTQIIELINLSKFQSSPLFLLGDFNEWLPTTKHLVKMNMKLNPISLKPTFPNSFPIFKLDRIWYSGQAEIISARVIKTKESKHYSDHYPILLECSLS